VAKISRIEDLESILELLEQAATIQACQITVLDGDFMTQKFVKGFFEGKGIRRIVTDLKPAQLLENLEESQVRHIVFYDLQHEKMNGIKFLQALSAKSESARKNTRLILLSATAMNPDIKGKLKSAGAFALLEKPLENHVLEDLSRRVLAW